MSQWSIRPSGCSLVLIGDEEVRRAACRALNRMKADMFAGFTDRLIPVATIPMHTPSEAIDELEFAVRDLKLRAVMMASLVPRAIKEAMRISPQAARFSYWIDTFGLDSEYDYDPVWAKCVELGVSPTFHSSAMAGAAVPRQRIISIIILGVSPQAQTPFAAGCSMGGVPKRFPQLKFAFLEGGVAWARSLYCDLISHWEKRNREALENYNPAHINTAEFTRTCGALWRSTCGRPCRNPYRGPTGTGWRAARMRRHSTNGRRAGSVAPRKFVTFLPSGSTSDARAMIR